MLLAGITNVAIEEARMLREDRYRAELLRLGVTEMYPGSHSQDGDRDRRHHEDHHARPDPAPASSTAVADSPWSSSPLSPPCVAC